MFPVLTQPMCYDYEKDTFNYELLGEKFVLPCSEMTQCWHCISMIREEMKGKESDDSTPSVTGKGKEFDLGYDGIKDELIFVVYLDGVETSRKVIPWEQYQQNYLDIAASRDKLRQEKESK